MNNTNSSVLRFVFFLLVVIGKTGYTQCRVSELVDNNKINIPSEYKYDGFLMNEFTFDLVNKNIHTEFVAFKNQKYQLFFYSSVFEEIVTISIYDKKDPAVKIAEKIIDSNTTSWIYELTKSATYSIFYEVSPSNTDVEHPGCIVMLIAFANK